MRDYSDEILFIEDYGESAGGISSWTIRASFADGTKFTAQAEIAMPPPEELTPKEVEYYDPVTGETKLESDEGQSEAWELESHTTAYRVLEQIRAYLARIPERPKKECPGCGGHMVCPACGGSGCTDCENSGVCWECEGRGWGFVE